MENTNEIFKLPEYFALISSLITLGIMIWTRFDESRKAKREAQKSENEAADTISDAAITLVSPLNQRIRELAEENLKLKKHIKLLEKQVRQAGEIPVSQPNGDA